MKSTKASAIASTLSPHAKPFIPDSPVLTRYSSPFQPEEYFSDGRAPAPVSTSSFLPCISPCLTLKKLEIACNSTCGELSSDDISSVDSPCYKGRNWSQITPLHIGETSTPPRVTVEKLREERNLSVAVTPVAVTQVACMIDSDKKEKGFSDPGMEKGSSREEMLLQRIVDLSDTLLRVPLNAAELAEGDYMKVKKIIEILQKLLDESKKHLRKSMNALFRDWYKVDLAKCDPDGLDKEKGKEHTYSTSCSQKRNFEDNEENIEATVYKTLWINAEIEKCELKKSQKNAKKI